MFRTILVELKKLVAKPGIYILALLLAVVLVGGVFIYEPQTHTSSRVTISETTVLDMSTAFDTTYKVSADYKLSNTMLNIQHYRLGGSTYKATFEEKITAFDTAYDAYFDYAHQLTTGITTQIETARQNVLTATNEIKNFVNTGLSYGTSENACYPIVSTKANAENFKTLIKSVYETFDDSDNSVADICNEYTKLYENEFKNCLNNFIFPKVNDSFITKYSEASGSAYSTLNQRLTNVENKIDDLTTTANQDSSINTNPASISLMEDYINDYISYINLYSQIIDNELIINAYSSTNSIEQLDLLNLDNKSQYNAKTILIKYNYLFDNDTFEDDFAYPLTIGVTSNNEANAYDYAYFVLKLFSFIIIAYSVFAIAQSVAGEQKDGTIRYEAIRPVNRIPLLLGKFLAVSIMSIILLIFSAILSMIVGYVMYGITSLPILTVFNGTTALVFEPWQLLLFFLLSLFIEIIIYTSIAMLLACLIKSDLLALAITMVIFLINLVLPLFVSGTNNWLAFYPFSHTSIFALFGSSPYAITDAFNLLMDIKVYSTTNIYLTLSVIIIILAICHALSYWLFKKKEF